MVQASRTSNLAAAIRTDNFEIISGVKPNLGGNDEGPNPHELLEGALAACTIITVQMYANHKKIKLESTNVIVKTISESKEHSVLERSISFVGELTIEEKAKLLEIADKCPIHKLLSSKIEIQTIAT